VSSPFARAAQKLDSKHGGLFRAPAAAAGGDNEEAEAEVELGGGTCAINLSMFADRIKANGGRHVDEYEREHGVAPSGSMVLLRQHITRCTGGETESVATMVFSSPTPTREFL
jgi:hypothetical protein